MLKILKFTLITTVILFLMGCDISNDTEILNQSAEAKGIIFKPACEQFTATNSTHVIAGRAYTKKITVYPFVIIQYFAKGTNDYLGSNGSIDHTLNKSVLAFGWKKGTCPAGKTVSINIESGAGHLLKVSDSQILQSTSPYPEVGSNRRSFVTFNTSIIPNDAVITKAYFTMRLRSKPDWMLYHEDDKIVLDIQSGHFGATKYTQPDDYGNDDGSDADTYSTPSNPLAEVYIYNWTPGTFKDSTEFSETARNTINKTGNTQFRLRVPADTYQSWVALYAHYPESMTLHITYKY